MSKQSRRSIGDIPKISADQLASLLSERTDHTVTNWPFEEIPLRLPSAKNEQKALRRFQNTTGNLLRITGMVSRAYDDGGIAVRIGGIRHDCSYLATQLPDVNLGQLLGMYIDLEVDLDDPDSALDMTRKNSTLRSIYRVESPLKPGDPRGIARGVVLDSPSGDNGFGLETGYGEITLTWDPDRLDYAYNYPGFLIPGSVIAARVTKQYPDNSTNYLTALGPLSTFVVY